MLSIILGGEPGYRSDHTVTSVLPCEVSCSLGMACEACACVAEPRWLVVESIVCIVYGVVPTWLVMLSAYVAGDVECLRGW